VATSRARPKRSRPKSSKKPTVRMLPKTRVAAAVKAMTAPSGTARFGAGKALSVTAAKDPGRVYPHFDDFAALLDSDSKVVRWNALQIIAALAPADAERKVDALLDTYLGFIRGAGRIAQVRPDLLDRIVPALLGVERAQYATPECRNVALGHVLTTLQELGPGVCRRPAVVEFIRRQRTNTRAAVARCAARMLAD
jgi:hypothetical protein